MGRPGPARHQASCDAPSFQHPSKQVLDPDWPALLEGLRAALPPKYSLKGGRRGDGGEVEEQHGGESAAPRCPPVMPRATRSHPPSHWQAVVTPVDAPGSSWLRVYCPLGMADLFGAHSSEE